MMYLPMYYLHLMIDDLDKQVPTEIEVLLGDIMSAERPMNKQGIWAFFSKRVIHLTVHGSYTIGYDHSHPKSRR